MGCAQGRELTEDSSTRQLTHDEHECVAFIRGFCEGNGEKMPHKTETRISFRKRHVFHEYRQQCEASNRSTFGKSKFYQLWSEHCADITTARWKGDFAICDKCKEFSQTTSNPLLTERERADARRRQQEHLTTILQCKKGYYARQYKAADREEQYMSVILDACDANTTLLPNIASRSKSEQSHGAAFLKHKLMAARVHGRRNRDYLYLMPPFAAKTVGCNLTLEALVRTLNFEADRRIQQNLAWPRTLFLQLDNTSKDNKNRTVFAFLSYLVQTEVFEEVFVNFLPVGATHEDIDQLFSVLTNRLRFNDAYTFEQWRAEMFAAFSNEPDKIMRVEYVWVLHDLREWLKPFAEKPYHGFRSGCFHFKIYRRNGQAVMSYMKYDFHANVPDGGYWPRNTEPKCWLPVLPPDLPQIDPTHGEWPVDPSGSSTIHDAESYLRELSVLLSLPTNRATPEDIETWRAWLHRIPEPGNAVGSDLYPSFTLPNRRAINARLGNAASYVDIDLASVEPERPADYDILLHQGQTKTQRERLKKVQEEARHIRPLLHAKSGDFVVYLVDIENEMMLADTQRGLSRESLSLPFSLGQVKGNAPAESDTLEVLVYYTKHGDPNEPWNAWIHEGRGQNHWSTRIPKSSVVLVNPTFRKQPGSKQKTLTADAKERLATVPGFPYTFVRGKGLIPWEKVSATLSQEMDDIPRAASKANLRRKKRLESTLRHQESMHHTLQQAQKRIFIETGANTDRP